MFFQKIQVKLKLWKWKINIILSRLQVFHRTNSGWTHWSCSTIHNWFHTKQNIHNHQIFHIFIATNLQILCLDSSSSSSSPTALRRQLWSPEVSLCHRSHLFQHIPESNVPIINEQNAEQNINDQRILDHWRIYSVWIFDVVFQNINYI